MSWDDSEPSSETNQYIWEEIFVKDKNTHLYLSFLKFELMILKYTQIQNFL